MPVKTLPELARKLSLEEPQAGDLKRASVAVVVKGAQAPSLLLIRRAERPGDPWSGQIAFPGGKSQAGDATLKDTAARETLEELGIDLQRQAEFLGYFGSFRTHTRDMDVYPAAFALNDEVKIALNAEVASFRWVPLDRLVALCRRSEPLLGTGAGGPVPAIRIDDYVVWGLTFRIISTLLS
jgi:8-oxo-dGTP pyrophosphatase MutT (NUDIX family)